MVLEVAGSKPVFHPIKPSKLVLKVFLYPNAKLALAFGYKKNPRLRLEGFYEQVPHCRFSIAKPMLRLEGFMSRFPIVGSAELNQGGALRFYEQDLFGLLLDSTSLIFSHWVNSRVNQSFPFYFASVIFNDLRFVSLQKRYLAFSKSGIGVD